MPRQKRQPSSTEVYHWIVRGMNKKDLFHDGGDYQHFRDLLKEYGRKYDVRIFHYCLMTNHVHLLIQSSSLEDMAKFSHFIQRRYAYYYSGKYCWNGSIFRRRYKSFPIDQDTYLLECGRYIERNPLKAHLARHPGGYPYSSFHYYAEGKEDELIHPSPAYLGLSIDEGQRRTLYADYVSQTRIQEEMTEKGLLAV